MQAIATLKGRKGDEIEVEVVEQPNAAGFRETNELAIKVDGRLVALFFVGGDAILKVETYALDDTSNIVELSK